MAVTAERQAFITAEFRIVKSGPDALVETKYGQLARKSTEPIPSFFTTEADAQAIVSARHALQSGDRRRFTTAMDGAATGLGLSYETTTPCVQVIDDERLANHAACVSAFSIDLAAETTTLETWG